MLPPHPYPLPPWGEGIKNPWILTEERVVQYSLPFVRRAMQNSLPLERGGGVGVKKL
jgi:hypothetical protein